MKTFADWWGVHDDIAPFDLALRALVMFAVALTLLRLSGMRPFGKGSAFDNVIIILLGGILSRGVVGATPFFSAVAGGVAVMAAHWIFAWASFHWRGAGKVVKGRETLLYKEGKFFEENMRREKITHADILEELRIKMQLNSLEEVTEVYFERNGEVSFVKKSS